MDDVWRCTVCGKTKPLSGPHLANKDTVRSDCWPCAKKRAFKRETAPHTDVNATPFPSTFSFPTVSVGKTTSKTEALSPPVGGAAAATAQSKTQPTAMYNPFLAAKAPATETKETEKRSSVAISTARHDSVGHPSAPTGATKSQTPTSGGDQAAPASLHGEVVWRCGVCGKRKDLSGPHLEGKTSVRSDCWPCAKKQTFLRTPALAATPAKIVVAGGKGNVMVTTTATAAAAAAAGSSTCAPFLYATSSVRSTSGSSRHHHDSNVSNNGSNCNNSPSTARGKSNPFLDKELAASVAAFASTLTAVNTNNNSSTAVSGSGGGGANPFHFNRTTSGPSSSHPGDDSSCSSAPAGLNFRGSTAVAAMGSRSPQLVMERRVGTSPPFTFKAVTPYPSADPTFSDPMHLLPTSTVNVPQQQQQQQQPETWTGISNRSSSSNSSRGVRLFPPTTTGAAAEWLSSEDGRPFAAQPTSSSSSAPASDPATGAAFVGATPASSADDFVWICSECRKIKHLAGPHLAGKSSVRSDCWPCGKKRVYIRVNRAELNRRSPSLSAMKQAPGTVAGDACAGSVSPLIWKGTSVQVPPSPSRTSRCGLVVLPETTASAAMSVGFGGAATAAAGSVQGLKDGGQTTATTPAAACHTSAEETVTTWCVPVIPPNQGVTDFYLLPEDDEDELSPDAVFCTATASPVLDPAALTLGDGGCGGVLAAGTPSRQHCTAALANSDGGGERSDLQRERGLVTVTIAASQRMQSLYNARLLHSYRLRVVEGVPLQAAWFGDVLYVIAEEPPAATLSLLSGLCPHTCQRKATQHGGLQKDPTATAAGPAAGELGSGPKQQHRLLQQGNRAYEVMGHFAALLMAIECKLATSRFRRMRRLFCASPFSFAASCCYVSQFTHSSSAAVVGSASATDCPVGPQPITVFGPSRDLTSAPTLWHRVIASCACAQSCVVSEEQRLRASQQLYRRVSWLAMPVDMTGAAIQLLMEEADEAAAVQRRRGDGITDTRDAEEAKKTGGGVEAEAATASLPFSALSTAEIGVDVVLLQGTVKLEDLPAAAALALPVKQF